MWSSISPLFYWLMSNWKNRFLWRMLRDLIVACAAAAFDVWWQCHLTKYIISFDLLFSDYCHGFPPSHVLFSAWATVLTFCAVWNCPFVLCYCMFSCGRQRHVCLQRLCNTQKKKKMSRLTWKREDRHLTVFVSNARREVTFFFVLKSHWGGGGQWWRIYQDWDECVLLSRSFKH